jgi:hypothetical protein
MKKSLVLNFHKETDGLLFEKIIIALKKRYKLVDLPFLVDSFNQKNEFENICHITFDDGELSFYNIVFPLLKKHNVPVSLFVSPLIIKEEKNFWFQDLEYCDRSFVKSLLSKKYNLSEEVMNSISTTDIFKCLPVKEINEIVATGLKAVNSKKVANQNMTLKQLKEVESSGLVTIGAHTLNHPILSNEDDESSYNEIYESTMQLADLLGHPIFYFAYPNGRPGLDFTEREKVFLKKAGVRFCFSTEMGHLSIKNDTLSIPRMGFPRMGLAPSNPLIALRLYLGKKWPDIKAIGRPSEKNIRNKIYSIVNINKSL